MASLQKEFDLFHGKIALSLIKKSSLRTSRDAIRGRIKKFFHKELKIQVPKFRGQGSYSMGTTVNPLDGEFDIDDGLYLQNLDEYGSDNWPCPAEVHEWIIEATKGHTNEKPIDKKTCVRIRYAGNYHVDLPSYSKLNGCYMIAEKGENGWHNSDPLAITDWFIKSVQFHGEQLRRFVRFLKAWSDFQSKKIGKISNGLILTVLAVQNYCSDTQDSIAFTQTINSIFLNVYPNFIVYNPIDSTEKLTDRLTYTQKERFQNAIYELASDAASATKIDDTELSSNLWRKQFGDRFPTAISDDNDCKQDINGVSMLAKSVPTTFALKPWAFFK